MNTQGHKAKSKYTAETKGARGPSDSPQAIGWRAWPSRLGAHPLQSPLLLKDLIKQGEHNFRARKSHPSNNRLMHARINKREAYRVDLHKAVF